MEYEQPHRTKPFGMTALEIWGLGVSRTRRQLEQYGDLSGLRVLAYHGRWDRLCTPEERLELLSVIAFFVGLSPFKRGFGAPLKGAWG